LAGHALGKEEMRNAKKILLGKSEGTILFGRPSTNGKLVLK